MKIYIWRDLRDKNMVSIGVRKQSGDYISWTSLFIDGVEEVFGRDVYDAISQKDFTGKVLPLGVTVEIGDPIE